MGKPKIHTVAMAALILLLFLGGNPLRASQISQDQPGKSKTPTPVAIIESPAQKPGAPRSSSHQTRTVEMVNGYRVVRGERPPIDYDRVPADAVEEGVLLIKFHRHMEPRLEANPPTKDRNGTVRFNIAETDTLNVRYGVRETNQHFRSPALQNTFTDRHKAWGFHLWYELRVDEKTDILRMMEAYRQLPEVEIAEPVFRKRLIDGLTDSGETVSEVLTAMTRDTWTPDDEFFNLQWHFYNTGQSGGTEGADISLLQAWAREKGHQDVIVAIIDDGIQYDHPDLAGNMWENAAHPNGGYNFVDTNTTIVPGNHGTHVAGTVAAVSNNEIGVAGVAGGSGSGDGVRLMSAQVFRAQNNTQGGFHLAPIWAADNGAAISQNSWGYIYPNAYNQNVLDAIDYFNANGGNDVMEGGITIFAAGNSNSSAAYYPGYYSGTLAVASTDRNDIKASNSNYGDWIDIAAPGVSVYSTLINGGYGFRSGTSMACPHVSGVAGLILSYTHRNGHKLAAEQVWDFLIEHADDIDHVNEDYIGKLGSGRLNAHLAVQTVSNTLTDVKNPKEVAAEGITDEAIKISWKLNDEDDDVMLVWAHDNVFGVPADGTAYAVEDEIPGGGKVLYRGGDLEFTHTGLNESTIYYYKVFSYSTQNNYSFGRTTSAKTLGPELVVVGLNKQYSQIPSSQLPANITLQALVENIGQELTTPVNINFSVQADSYAASIPLDIPMAGNTTSTVTSTPAWETADLSTGEYVLSYEADHVGSDHKSRKDTFALNVTESVYARDNGLVAGGVGYSVPISLGMKYTILNPVIIFAANIHWPFLPQDDLDFSLSLVRIDNLNHVSDTILVSEAFTRKQNMGNTIQTFSLESSLLEPGYYILAVNQLSDESIILGIDRMPYGYYYVQDISDPKIFHKISDFGNLTLRIVLDDISVTTWTGTTNNDWHTAANWTDGIPDAQTSAVIPANTDHHPNINSTAHVYDLLLENDASLVDNENLTIHGRFTMERQIEAAGGWGEGHDATDWHFLSAPVSNQEINGKWTPSGAAGGYDFYAYQEDPPLWLNQKTGANNITHFIPGKGYLVAYELSDNKYFEGQPNTGTVSFTLSKKGDGWNLLGNPYPSAIDWNLVSQHTSYFDDVFAYIYNRNKEGGAGYVTIDGSTANAWIPANQGFFVKATEDDVIFAFTNNLRAHGDSFMKEDKAPDNELQIRLSGPTHHYDNTVLRIRENASHLRDPLDALKLFSFSNAVPQLYSLTEDGVMVAINSIPYINKEMPVALGIHAPENGDHSLSLQDAGGVFATNTLLLEDASTGVIHDLQNDPVYTFQTDAGDVIDRFFLHFDTYDDDATNIHVHQHPYINIWYHGNILHINNPIERIQLNVYDLTGRQLQSHTINTGKHQHQLNLPTGVYILESYGNSHNERMKIIISNE